MCWGYCAEIYCQIKINLILYLLKSLCIYTYTCWFSDVRMLFYAFIYFIYFMLCFHTRKYKIKIYLKHDMESEREGTQWI